MYSVYVLIDPRDDAIRYVGITNDVYARFSQHLRCDSTNISKNAWIQGLKDENVMLIMRTIDTAETFEQAREREMHWIKHHMKQGNNLLNIDGVRSITFNQFMAFFGQPEEAKSEQEAEDEAEAAENEIVPDPAPTRKQSSSSVTPLNKRIQKLLKKNPSMTYSAIARKVGSSRSYVHKIKNQMDQEKEPQA